MVEKDNAVDMGDGTRQQVIQSLQRIVEDCYYFVFISGDLAMEIRSALEILERGDPLSEDFIDFLCRDLEYHRHFFIKAADQAEEGQRDIREARDLLEPYAGEPYGSRGAGTL